MESKMDKNGIRRDTSLAGVIIVVAAFGFGEGLPWKRPQTRSP